MPVSSVTGLGHRLERGHVAPGLGLGDPVGHDQTFSGNAAQPVRLLLGRARDKNRVGSKTDGRGRPVASPRSIAAISSETATMSWAPPPRPVRLLGEKDKVETHFGR